MLRINKMRVFAVAASFIVGGSAVAGLNFNYGVNIVSAIYSIEKPITEPNLLSNQSFTFTHKLYATTFDPNQVQAQRRIRQGWKTEADPGEYCIDNFGNRNTHCNWQDWNISWDFSYNQNSSGSIKVYTSQIDIPGSAYATWPLFPEDEGYYTSNPNFTYVAPETKYYIETRFMHPVVGWLYDTTEIKLWCNGENAWQHDSGMTTCPGI